MPITIDVLGLSRRAYNCLRRVGIDTLDQLADLSDEHLLAIPMLGDIVLAEIRIKLGAYLADHPLPERPASVGAAQQNKRARRQAFAPSKTQLYALGLSNSTRELLEQKGVVTVGRLIRMPLGQYVSTKGLHKKARKEIEKTLQEYLDRFPLALSEPLFPMVEPELLERVAAAPLDQICLERLALPDKLRVRLQHQGIKSLGGLAHRSADTLARPGPIKTQLRRYLVWLAEQDREAWAGEVAGLGISPLHELALTKSTLQSLVYDWLACLDQRRNRVIRWRYGLDGKRLTLKEVGQKLGVSRERARQIQASALAKLSQPRNRERIAPFRALVEHLLTESGGVMSIESLRAVLQQRVTPGDLDPGAALRLLAGADEDLQCSRKAKVCGLSRYPLSAVKDVHKRLARLLAASPVPLSTQELFEQFKETKCYARLHDELDDAFLLACLRAYPGQS